MAATSVVIKDYSNEIAGSLVDDTTWVFPEVKSVNAHGRTSTWTIKVRLIDQTGRFVPILQEYFANKKMPEGIRGWIKVDSGVNGGKIRDSAETIVSSGKNIGRANETNVFCQALRDALGLYNKQKKKAFGTESAAAGPKLYPPMLSKVFVDLKKPPKISPESPVFVQRKYNGVRAVITGETLYSRGLKIYPGCLHIKAELHDILARNPGLYLDGEIYKHGVPLQEISGSARGDDDSLEVQYMVYDCFIDGSDMPYSKRKELLERTIPPELKYVKVVETYIAVSHDEVNHYYEQFLREGYEGAMVRLDTPYKYSYNNYHSANLLKIKKTHDAEYKVVGWTTGEKGKAASALMIICEAHGKEFPVTPALEIPVRNELAKKMAEIESNGKTHFENHWKGVEIIVYYDELSTDGIPQRARTKLEKRVD